MSDKLELTDTDKKIIEQTASELVSNRRFNSRSSTQGFISSDNRLEMAYLIQQEVTNMLIKYGDEIIGRKIGVTTNNLQQKFGITEPVWGTLFSSMDIPNGSVLNPSSFPNLRLELEVAFVIGKEINNPKCTTAEVLSSIEYATAAFEIVSSRYSEFPSTIFNIVSDNVMAGGLVLGHSPKKVNDVDLANFDFSFQVNDDSPIITQHTPSIASPINCLVWLARKMAKLNQPLTEGQTVIAGSLIPMYPVNPGDRIVANIENLGCVSIDFSGAS